jgi:hypothetical protein
VTSCILLDGLSNDALASNHSANSVDSTCPGEICDAYILGMPNSAPFWLVDNIILQAIVDVRKRREEYSISNETDRTDQFHNDPLNKCRLRILGQCFQITAIVDGLHEEHHTDPVDEGVGRYHENISFAFNVFHEVELIWKSPGEQIHIFISLSGQVVIQLPDSFDTFDIDANLRP